MATAARVGPRWIDPDRVWAGAGSDPVTPADESVTSEGCQIDRFHNHENMSPEALAQAVNQLQASLAAMTDRVAALEAAEGSTLDATRRLGMDVIELAGALARRVRALEQPSASEPPASPGAEVVAEVPAPVAPVPAVEPEAVAPVAEAAESTPPFLFVQQPAPRKKPASGLAVVLGLLVALALALAAAAGGLWYYRSQGHALTPVPKPAPVIHVKPRAPSAPVVTTTPVAKPPTVSGTHKPTVAKHDSGESADATGGAPTGHMLYGVSPAPSGALTSSGAAPAKP